MRSNPAGPSWLPSDGRSPPAGSQANVIEGLLPRRPGPGERGNSTRNLRSYRVKVKVLEVR